jgi:hypothetical protein
MTFQTEGCVSAWSSVLAAGRPLCCCGYRYCYYYYYYYYFYSNYIIYEENIKIELADVTRRLLRRFTDKPFFKYGNLMWCFE